jgi:hypothetical protein
MQKKAHLSLWDISPQAIANLMETYSGQGHRIATRPARPQEKAIQQADLLFIDPPGLKGKKETKYPQWEAIREFLATRPEGQAVLLWLPVKAVTLRDKKKLSPPGEDDASWAARNDAVTELHFRSIRVRWATGGRTIGCHLIHSLPDAAAVAMTKAVEGLVNIAGWSAELAEYGLTAIQ